MNTYYDLIIHPDWRERIAAVRVETEARLREWFQKHNAEDEQNIILSNIQWIGDRYTQIIRCRTEYQAFEGRLMFGEFFDRVVVTEQEEGPFVFK